MKSVAQLEAHLSARLPDLSPAPRKGLAYGVVGTVRAGSACLNAVCSLRATDVAAHGRLRPRLRLWMRDKPSSQGGYGGPAVDVRSCFVPLRRWILSLGQGSAWVLALDPTSHRDRVVSLAVRVAGALWARSCALPVAWQGVPAQQPSGSWVQAYCDLLPRRAPGHSRQQARHGAVRPGNCQSAAVGCHLSAGLASLPAVPAAHPLSEPGALWARSPPARAGLGDPARPSCGAAGTALGPGRRRRCTRVAVWGAQRAAPWILLRIHRRPRSRGKSMGCGSGWNRAFASSSGKAGMGIAPAAATREPCGRAWTGTGWLWQWPRRKCWLRPLGCGWRMPPSSVDPWHLTPGAGHAAGPHPPLTRVLKSPCSGKMVHLARPHWNVK